MLKSFIGIRREIAKFTAEKDQSKIREIVIEETVVKVSLHKSIMWERQFGQMNHYKR